VSLLLGLWHYGLQPGKARVAMDQIKIERATITQTRFALNPPLRTAREIVAVREAFILRLFDRDGLVGAGEAAPAHWIGGETLAQTCTSLQQIAARVAMRATALVELRRWARLSEATAPGEDAAPLLSAAALNALDCAMLELCAKRAGCGVAELLSKIAPGAGLMRPVCVSFLLTAESIPALVAEARAAVDAGFRTFKLKIGAGADDIARVRAVIEAIGANIALRLDANGAFDYAQARTLLSTLASVAAIEFVEEPLRRCRPEELVRLREQTGVRIALDESFADRASLKSYLDAHAADIIVLKATRLGGLSRCVELAALAAGAGLKPCVTDSIEGPLGMTAAVHLAAALPAPSLAVGLGGARYAAASDSQAVELGHAPFPSSSSALQATGPGFFVRALQTLKTRTVNS
jgi:o-succinylbenzoate synthase